jgi:excisionase family DNA binding protein
METIIPDDLITTRAAAKLAGNCHLSTILRWILTDKLGGWRRGGRWYVSRAEVLAMWEAPRGRKLKVRSSPWALAESARLGID